MLSLRDKSLNQVQENKLPVMQKITQIFEQLQFFVTLALYQYLSTAILFCNIGEIYFSIFNF